MNPDLLGALREFLLRVMREREDEYLAIEAEMLLKWLEQESAAPRIALPPNRGE